MTMLDLGVPVEWKRLTVTGMRTIFQVRSRTGITHHVRMKVRKPTGGDIIIKPWNERQTERRSGQVRRGPVYYTYNIGI